MNILKIRFDSFPISEGFIYDELFFGEYDIKTYVYCKNRMNSRLFPDVPFLAPVCARDTRLWQGLYNDLLKQRFFKNRVLKSLFLKDIPRILEHMKKLRVRLIHTHFVEEAIFACLLNKGYKTPLLMSFHGGYDTHVFPVRHPRLFLETLAQAQYCFVRSNWLKKKFIEYGVDERKIKVLYRGIDTEYWSVHRGLRPLDNKVRIAFVGRFVEKKGLLVFLRSIVPILQSTDHVEVDIVGDQPSPWIIRCMKQMLYACGVLSFVEGDQFIKEKASRIGRESGVAHRITWHGALSRDEVRRIFQKVDIVVAPSQAASDGDHEGIPGVVLEAMSMECAVIVTRHEGIEEIVDHNRNGLLVEERDVSSIQDRLRYLIARPDERVRLGKAARATIQDVCGFEKQKKALADRYYECLSM